MRSFSTAAGEEIPALRQVSSLDIEDSLKPWLETNAMELIESKGMWAERAIHRNGPSVEFQVTAGGEPWRITYDVGTRAFRADPLERRLGSISVRNLLTSLHTTHGFPPEMRSHSFWALAVDCMGGGLIVWAVSGILMWWQMPKVRLWGGVTLTLSLVMAGGLGYAMYAVFTN